MSIACVDPGQTAQFLGLLSKLSQRFRTVRETFKETSDIVSIDSWLIVTHGPEYEFNTLSNPQPIMLATGVAVGRVGTSQYRCYPCVISGHSFREYTALGYKYALEFREQVYVDSSLTAIYGQDCNSYEQTMQCGGEVS
jgi:[acyl-carrier-protein] S-malonyltransferase